MKGAGLTRDNGDVPCLCARRAPRSNEATRLIAAGRRPQTNATGRPLSRSATALCNECRGFVAPPNFFSCLSIKRERMF